MYSLAQVRKGLRHPRLAVADVVGWERHNEWTRTLFDRRNPPMIARDWDTLVVLDACRYDLFAQHAELPGSIDRHYSCASNTAEWLERSFAGREFPEIVYVTATPKYIRQEMRECFHDIVSVWQDDWDEELRTVHPEVMTERVLAAHERFPNKRILAHYIQPHIPFIGETGRQIPHEVIFAQTIVRQDTDQQNFWEALEAGRIDRDRAWRAYCENLEIALPHVEDLLASVQGRTVVTADHGNVFGEHGLYGHPPNRHVKQLITVPWLVSERGTRRDIEAGEIRSQADHYEAVTSTDEVSSRLTDLGYLDG